MTEPRPSGPRWTPETLRLVSRRGVGFAAAEDILEALADAGLLVAPEVLNVLGAAREWAATGRAGGFDHMAASLRLLVALDAWPAARLAEEENHG